LKFAECMRSSGVPNFPDPGAGGSGLKVPINEAQSPAFLTAQQSCRKELPGGGPPRVVPESAKVSMIRHAECMRAHGVPSYPDPTFPPGGGIAISFGNVNPNSPAFQGAANACGGMI
jgi:hypothetical protein